jgi:hypothetical protein
MANAKILPPPDGGFPCSSLSPTNPARSPASLITSAERPWPTDTPPLRGDTPSKRLFFLTLNVQKAGHSNPSQVDAVSILDTHTPDFHILTDTLLLPHNGALTHILRNKGHKIHFHPTNASSPPDMLLKARLPAHIIRSGNGSWIAHKNHTTWSTNVRPLLLPTDCPKTFTCEVELTLLTGEKAAIIASYLP